MTPYARNIARSLVKNPKIYFFDTGMVRGDPGVIFENMTAVCLLKHVLGQTDMKGKEFTLHYLRTRNGKETDFCVAREGKAELLVESKFADREFDRSLFYFSERIGVPGVQVVNDLLRERESGRLKLRMAENFFPEL